MESHEPAAEAVKAAIDAAVPNLWASRTAANAVAGVTPGSPARAKHLVERAAQAALLREIFGNPFRPVLLEQSWLAWNDGAIRKMAQLIYGDRAFDRLPMLADALEDAGCTDADLLAHCRSGGEHVRGCWVVDLLLGKS